MAEIQVITKDQIVLILQNSRVMQERIMDRCKELDDTWMSILKDPIAVLIRMDSKDLLMELERIQQESHNSIRIIEDELVRLKSKYNRISRVMLCFDTLPPEEHDVLEKLYVQNMTWEAAGMELEKSSSHIFSRMKDGLTHMIQLYNSDYSDNFIAARTFDYFFSVRRRKRTPNVTSDTKGGRKIGVIQMTIEDYLDLGDEKC